MPSDVVVTRRCDVKCGADAVARAFTVPVARSGADPFAHRTGNPTKPPAGASSAAELGPGMAGAAGIGSLCECLGAYES
jgi:hypothetical protein